MTTQAKRQKRAWACMHAFEFVQLAHPALAEKIYNALPAKLQAELDAAFPPEGDNNGVPAETGPETGED